MDAMTLLKDEHATLRALLARLPDGAGSGRRREQVREVAALLILHAQGEEGFVYRALEDTGDAEASQRLAEARFQHARLEDLIEYVVTMEERDGAFERGVAEFERTALAHLREEEVRLFPLADRLIGATEREVLGRAMAEWRNRLDVAA